MEERTLGRTGLCVTRLCFGTMTLGGQADQPTSMRLMDRCLDAGINFFDTANVYNKGRSEELVGQALKGRRDKIVLASKVRFPVGEGANEKGLSKAAIHKAIEDSLRRLQTDYIDLYYLHAPDYEVPAAETLEALEELVQAGKIRYPATSNYASWQVGEMLAIARENGYCPATVAQPMYNLLARGIEQEFVPMARHFGVSLVVYNPLAGGLLTGKQKAGAPVPGTRFDNNQMYLDRYWHPAYFDALEKLRKIATDAGRSMVSLSLNWLLHHSPADAIILGASTPEQLETNLRVVNDGPLPGGTLQACDEVWQQLRGVTPRYNR